jgi:hypothetical protein
MPLGLLHFSCPLPVAPGLLSSPACSRLVTKYNSHIHHIIFPNICIRDRDTLLNVVYVEIFLKRVYEAWTFFFYFVFYIGHQATDWTLEFFVTQKCFSPSDWHVRALSFFLSQFTLSPSLFYEPHQLYFPFISESYSTTGHFVAQRITPKHTSDRVDVLTIAMIWAPASAMHFTRLYYTMFRVAMRTG